MKIFVSYAREDSEFVDRLYDGLTALGYAVWTDRRRIPGLTHDQWRYAVVEAIKASSVFVIVISPDSTASKSVERELTVAADKSKRLVPVIHRVTTVPDEFGDEGEVEYDGVFAFVLTGLEYVDFTKSSFEDGMDRLATHLGPVEDASKYNVSALVSAAIAHENAAGHDDENEHSTDTTPPEDEPVSPGGRDDGSRWRTVGLIAGVVIVAAALVWLGIALWPSPGPEQDDADDVVVSTTTTERDEAIALVAQWANATTQRDFDAAARIDPSRSAAELEHLYRPASEPIRMISVQPYVADATQDGELWRLTGAAMGWDYNPEPTVRTHVMCSEWEVDLSAGTATWITGPDTFLEGERVTSERFAEAYETYCT